MSDFLRGGLPGTLPILRKALQRGNAKLRKAGVELEGLLPLSLGAFLGWLAGVANRVGFLWRQIMQCVSTIFEQRLADDPDCTVEFLQSSHPSDVNRDIVGYVEAGLRASRWERSFSVVVDKSRVSGKGLLNSAVVLPSNKAWWMIPQASRCSAVASLRASRHFSSWGHCHSLSGDCVGNFTSGSSVIWGSASISGNAPFGHVFSAPAGASGERSRWPQTLVLG